MTDAKHTPGPWRVNGQKSVRGPNLEYIANANWKNGEANARLIAAAPDLLEALIMVRDADDDCKSDGLPTIPSIARATINAAISKATTPTT